MALHVAKDQPKTKKIKRKNKITPFYEQINNNGQNLKVQAKILRTL